MLTRRRFLFGVAAGAGVVAVGSVPLLARLAPAAVPAAAPVAAATNFAALSAAQKMLWSRDVWQAARNESFLSRFVGGEENYVMQHITELKRTSNGSRAVMTLVGA
jgi:hypothetical protein